MENETETNSNTGWLDKVTEKVISRKFLSWIVATVLLAFDGSLDADNWMTITAIYIGGQSVIDAVERLKKK